MSTVGALRANPQAVSSAFNGAAQRVGNAVSSAADRVGGALNRTADAAGGKIKSAAQGASNAYRAGESKAGDLGAQMGESYGRSSLTTVGRNTAAAESGMAARGRMADRMKPNPAFDMSRGTQFTRGPQAVSARSFSPEMSGRGPQMGEQASGRMQDPNANQFRQKALDDAQRIGSTNGANAFAGSHARQGRVIARHAFRAGLVTAGAAAGVAAGSMGGGSLSQAQHEERVNAGKHSHQGMSKADPCWDGYKQLGMKRKGKKQVPNCVPGSAEKAHGLRERFAMAKGETIAPPVQHNSSRFLSGISGAIGGAGLGAAAGLWNGGHHAVSGTLIGAALGLGLGVMASQREHVEDSGQVPSLALGAAGSIGILPRALGRVATADSRSTHKGFGAMEYHDHAVREAQDGHRADVTKLNARRGKGELSEAEHAQRVAASRARWVKHVAEA